MESSASKIVMRDFPVETRKSTLLELSIHAATSLNYSILTQEANSPAVRLRKPMSWLHCMMPQKMRATHERDNILLHVEDNDDYRTLVARGDGVSDSFLRALDKRLVGLNCQGSGSSEYDFSLLDSEEVHLETDPHSFKREAKAFIHFTLLLTKMEWSALVDRWKEGKPENCMERLRVDVVDQLMDWIGPAPNRPDMLNLWELAPDSVERFIFVKVTDRLWDNYKQLYAEEDQKYRDRNGWSSKTPAQVLEHFDVKGDSTYIRASTLLHDLEKQWERSVIISRTESLEKLQFIRIMVKTEAIESGDDLESMDELVPVFCAVVILANLKHPFALYNLLQDLMWLEDERKGSDGMVVSLLETAVTIGFSECVSLDSTGDGGVLPSTSSSEQVTITNSEVGSNLGSPHHVPDATLIGATH